MEKDYLDCDLDCDLGREILPCVNTQSGSRSGLF